MTDGISYSYEGKLKYREDKCSGDDFYHLNLDPDLDNLVWINLADHGDDVLKFIEKHTGKQAIVTLHIELMDD